MTKPIDRDERFQQDEIMREMRAIKREYAKEYNYDAHAILDRVRQRALEEGLEGKGRKPRRIEVRETA